jgi:hypothetical protein
MRKKTPLNRRHFLRTSIFGMLGAGMATKGGWAREKEGTRTHSRDIENLSPPKIKDYRILGRTGFKVSDLAVGSVQDEGLIGTMLDAGINYIDTAESYPGHHRIVGNSGVQVLFPQVDGRTAPERRKGNPFPLQRRIDTVQGQAR